MDLGEGLARTFVRVKDAGGMTALHFAAVKGKTQLCKYLVLDLGIDVNLEDRTGDTPLNYATLGQQNQTAAWLAGNGADPNLGNAYGFCALHYAAQKGLKDLMRLLISKGAEIDAESHAGAPLRHVASRGRKEAIKMLLDRKANPNMVCYRFLTPLVRSIFARSFECACLLLKAGADPNLDLDGVTPLWIAAAEGEADIIKCMLKAGANPNITDTDGLTPLEIAAGRGNDAASGLKRRETFLLSKSRGEEALKRKDYTDAIYWYSKAIDIAPDATTFCNRSLCWARLNEGSHALSDAEACIALRPDWGKARYRVGVAWKLLGNLPMSFKAFSKGSENKELKVAFREAVVTEGVGIPVSEGIRIIRL